MAELQEAQVLDQTEVEEFRKPVSSLCFTCGKVIAHLRPFYLTGIEEGSQPSAIFDLLNVDRYCCRTHLANPSLIAEGKIYNNPQIKGKVEFATQEAADFMGQITVNSLAAQGTIVTYVPEVTGKIGQLTIQSVSTSKLPEEPTTSSTAIP